MKVGILTYHNAHNYGAALQAYGLQKQLRDMGENPEFIHYYSEETESRNAYKRPISRPKDLLINIAYKIFAYKLKARFENFESFIGSYLEKSPRYRTLDALREAEHDYDAIVCGSDQIWSYAQGASPVYYATFVPSSIPLIAYAPSFGRYVAADSAPPKLKDWVARFSSLSVRELNGVQMLQKLTGREVAHVLDPAFFVSPEDWKQVAVEPGIGKPYLLFYALEISQPVVDFVSRVSTMLKLNIVIAGKGGSLFFSGRSKLAIESGPREFLGLIKGASLVISNSFHATVFSILMRVPFLTLGHSERNERIRGLLELVNEQERLIMPEALEHPLEREMLTTPISEQNLARLEPEIKQSKKFLKESLQQADRTQTNRKLVTQ